MNVYDRPRSESSFESEQIEFLVKKYPEKIIISILVDSNFHNIETKNMKFRRMALALFTYGVDGQDD